MYVYIIYHGKMTVPLYIIQNLHWYSMQKMQTNNVLAVMHEINFDNAITFVV